jgi:hypothetical protein
MSTLGFGQTAVSHSLISISAVDETGVIIPGVQITVTEPGENAVELWTDFAGRCTYRLQGNAPYRIHAEKAGFYQADESNIESAESAVRITLAHQQVVREQVDVVASPPGIDPEQVPNTMTMNTPEIVNIPYPTSRDIRNLLPFTPGVVQDETGQVHVSGSETWQTLDMLDGFDIRSPVSGVLALRVSSDAVRVIDQMSTRYPVEFGRSTGGVVAFYTGMGDNKFRFNATNFIPSFRNIDGIRFDKFVPRFTFSGPIKRDRVWWYDGLELEYSNIYIRELPKGENTNQLSRGSNLIKVQANLRPENILKAGYLFNALRSPYDGISPLVPRVSTTKRDTVAWLAYARDQWSFHRGSLLDVGVDEVRIRDGYMPHGDTPYQITPEVSKGSYFENLAGHSARQETTAALYLSPRYFAGQHDLRIGVDVDRVSFEQKLSRAPVSYLREDGTLVRQSTFAAVSPYSLHNDEVGAYMQDRWKPRNNWLFEPGLRFDWDSLVRRPLFAPRLAAIWTPEGGSSTKVSAGIGIYYDHTQLQYLAQSLTGARSDTYYATNGLTPLGPAQQSPFTADRATLQDPRAVNWSVAIERKLPWSLFGGASYIQKQTSHQFTYVNQSGPVAFSGNYQLANVRLDGYHAAQFNLRRVFADGYTLFFAYTHSSATTNAALQYWPTPSPLGAQQGGPLPWDVPNRAISWGWLPLDLPFLKKSWDFVYTLNWQSGMPYTAVDAAQHVVGSAGAYRFPTTVDFSPGVEWRFHFWGTYYGLRGVMENALDRPNPLVVNNVVDSPAFGIFSEPEGRAFTARIRIIASK